MSRKSDRLILPSDAAPGEERLLKAYQEFASDEFPNPERKGCPGTEVLEILASDVKAFRRRSDSQEVLRHIGSCGPCGQELNEIRAKVVRQARSRSTRTVLLSTALLAVFATGAFLLWKTLAK